MTKSVSDSDGVVCAEGLVRLHTHPLDLPPFPSVPGPGTPPPAGPRAHQKVVPGELRPGELRHTRRVVIR